MLAMQRVKIYLELGKARLTALVLLTTLVGYVLAPREGLNWSILLATLVGTALCAWAANALNQWAEWQRDARMHRTQNRPLPARQLNVDHAFKIALIAAVVGSIILMWQVNLLAAMLAVLTILLYVLVYTPMKVRSTLNTLVGAVVGAIPPMIGWAAASGSLEAGAWVLAGVLLVWQIPHFLSLAWMYREDYVRGGFRMLPSIDPTGTLTGRVIVLWSLALVPMAAGLSFVGATGWWYAAGSLALGGWLLVRAVGLRREVNRLAARRVFLASVIYLPLLLGLMMIDRGSVDVSATTRVESPVPVVPAMHLGDNPTEPAVLGRTSSTAGTDPT